jgi:cytochrome oxidase assembly protein ShyY1
VVWQNLDLARYAREVPFPLQLVVIQLSPDSSAGGFAREWPRPDERIERHVGYAFQWWGFAIATVIIWLVVNLRRKPPASMKAADAFPYPGSPQHVAGDRTVGIALRRRLRSLLV